MRILPHKAMLLCCSLLLAGAVASAQQHPGGGPPAGNPGGGPGGPGGGARNGGLPGGNGPSANGRPGDPTGGPGTNGRNGMPGGGGSQPGLSGRWWDDKGIAKTIGLSKDQQRKMDGVFAANRPQLLESYNALQREESNLEALNKEKKPDEARIFASIDAVAQARAALAKANAHMLLQVRQEMDAEQNARMQKLREQSGED
jgi:Spy/CpxP family protein refolding chaperone